MTRKLKIILISIVVFIVSLGSIGYIIYETTKPKIVTRTNNRYTILIQGAVEKPGSYTFSTPKKLREIIFLANVLTSADLNSLDLNKIFNEDTELVIPYKVNMIKKIKWKDLINVRQLTDLGIKVSIAQSVLEHRRQNDKTTWEQILAIRGIGQVTLSQLKDIIDLS